MKQSYRIPSAVQPKVSVACKYNYKQRKGVQENQFYNKNSIQY